MRRDAPKVSVCALSYNSGEFTEMAIRSALDSQYPNLEVICIDDSSTDSSAERLLSLSQELGFAFFENSQNLGIPSNCNRALSLSTGEYLILVGDDVLLPNRIQGDVDILTKNPTVGFVCSSAKVINKAGVPSNNHYGAANDNSEGAFTESPEMVWLNGSRVFTPTITYRKSTLSKLGGFDSHFDSEDRAMLIQFAKEGIRGWSRNSVTTLYRRHDENFSAKFKVSLFAQELALIEHFELKIAPWRISAKFLFDAHYWMLFLGISSSDAVEALSMAGRNGFAWTTTSKLFKVTYLALTFFRRGRYVNRNVMQYLGGDD